MRMLKLEMSQQEQDGDLIYTIIVTDPVAKERTVLDGINRIRSGEECYFGISDFRDNEPIETRLLLSARNTLGIFNHVMNIAFEERLKLSYGETVYGEFLDE